jgi:hypothetical protein
LINKEYEVNMDTRVNHKVVIDGSKVVEGNNVYPCSLDGCEKFLTLVWDGKNFSLTEKDRQDPTLGEIAIEYVDGPPKSKNAESTEIA